MICRPPLRMIWYLQAQPSSRTTIWLGRVSHPRMSERAGTCIVPW